MKTVSLLLITITFVIAAVPCTAEISLPELAGDYTNGEGVLVDVDFGQAIPDMSLVSLELVGFVTVSWITIDGVTYDWGGEFTATFAEPDPGFWMSGSGFQDDPDFAFYSLVPFDSLFGATSDFVADGQAQMYFEFAPLGIAGTVDDMGPPPVGTILAANLIIDGTIANESGSWGNIKTLYR
jgi:hypothetical protein